MADLFCFIRSQDNQVLSSINGQLFTVLLFQDERLILDQPVDLFLAEALFFNVPPSTYRVVALHPDVNPVEAQQFISLSPQTAVFGIRFIYSEPERQLLRIETSEYRVDG